MTPEEIQREVEHALDVANRERTAHLMYIHEMATHVKTVWVACRALTYHLAHPDEDVKVDAKLAELRKSVPAIEAALAHHPPPRATHRALQEGWFVQPEQLRALGMSVYRRSPGPRVLSDFSLFAPRRGR